MYSGIFTQLNDDSYAPTTPKLNHQQWDNYGIYSLACINTSAATIKTTYNYKKTIGKYDIVAGKLVALDPPITIENVPEKDPKLSKFLAWQSHSNRSIPIDFRQYVETYKQLGSSTSIPYRQYLEVNNV
jgi:hypothetical protein